jgi:hypothetical protein
VSFRMALSNTSRKSRKIDKDSHLDHSNKGPY